MEGLPAAAATLVASYLEDERDLAALRCACRFWRDILKDNPGLWGALLARRFGQADAAPAAPASSAGAAPPAETPEQRFKRLASLRQPVAGLEKLIWLDGQHLQVGAAPVQEPGHCHGSARCCVLAPRGGSFANMAGAAAVCTGLHETHTDPNQPVARAY